MKTLPDTVVSLLPLLLPLANAPAPTLEPLRELLPSLPLLDKFVCALAALLEIFSEVTEVLSVPPSLTMADPPTPVVEIDPETVVLLPDPIFIMPYENLPVVEMAPAIVVLLLEPLFSIP